VGYDAATRVATLTPTAALAAGTTYTATLTGGASAIRDVANNPLATVSWTFTTAAAADRTAPTVTARSPAGDATGIAVGTSVKATFSEAVQGLTTSTFTLRAAGATSNATAGVAYDAASRTATLTPSSALAANTRYAATLTNAVKDVAGNPLAATTWTFTTAAAADRTAPTVSSRSPGSGATGVNRNGNVTVTFSEAVTGVSSTTFTIRKSSGGSAVTAAVKRDGTTNRWILDPGSTLSSSTTYTVTVTGGTSGIKDAAGNPFGTTTWTFRTGTST
jgi:Bacterial Ig-like domain